MTHQYHSSGSYAMLVKPLSTFLPKILVAYGQSFIYEQYFRCDSSRYGKMQAGLHT